MGPGTDFAPAVDRWVDGLGRIRDVVRQRLVAAELADLLAARAGGVPLRVLDAGCGQGTQALALARAGHAVTGLDPSTELLDRFRTALAAEPGDELDRLLAAEREAGRRDPYRGVAALAHLVYARVTGAGRPRPRSAGR